MDPQRRSSIVLLTAIGVPTALAITEVATMRSPPLQRNLYADRAACERDYPPSQCEAQGGSQSGSSGSSYHSYWHGPYYSSDRSSAAARSDPGPGRSGARSGVETASARGGFGAYGRSAGAGGRGA